MFNMTLLYMNRNIPLQAKILFGYMMLMAVIISMAAILFHEHARLRKIEADTYEIRQARRDISEIHRNITVLASLGESVIAWEDEDYHAYQTRRLRVDSLLQMLQTNHSYIFGLSQIDTLQQLLADKETHLHQIMQVFHRQDKADSLLVNHLPEAARQATQTRTVVQKKKGIAGWFGGKETVQVPASSDKLRSLNEQLIALQAERIRNMENYTDSLRIRNRELNRKLFALLGNISDHAQAAFRDREEQIAQAHQRSTSIITGLIIAAILGDAVNYSIGRFFGVRLFANPDSKIFRRRHLDAGRPRRPHRHGHAASGAAAHRRHHRIRRDPLAVSWSRFLGCHSCHPLCATASQIAEKNAKAPHTGCAVHAWPVPGGGDPAHGRHHGVVDSRSHRHL